MDWSWVDSVVGAGIGIASYAVGQARGRRSRRRDPFADDPQPVCGCGHHYSLHDGEGGCHGTHRVVERVSRDGKTWATQECGCARYTGPRAVAAVPPLTA